MEAELLALEARLGDLLRAHSDMRGENSRLRHELAELRDAHARLEARATEAARRLDAVLEKLPLEDE